MVKNAADQQVINSGQLGFVQSASAPPVIVLPQQGVPLTMPSNVAQNNSSGRGIGKRKEGECAVRSHEYRAPAARGTQSGQAD